MRNYNNNLGFTLMEVLVATSIFAIISLASLSIYTAILTSGQKTTALTRIQSETQFIMQVLAKKVRTSRVDYNYYETHPINNTTGNNDLVLIDNVGDEFIFSLDEINSTIKVSVNDGAEKIIPSANVNIDDLKFYINPTNNPYSLDAPPSSQPYVTIVMTVSSSKGRQSASLTVQQTVPQRSALTL
ncbi:prepilin-type N-terminal cleavage/methylation domain-containing protein [Patescibacteria group bacterium]|nr:prepilin-type N-terminal cleavage/methylation domain-containing protein [Patescibacteria group bacterium]MBU4482358.1 prepilin-type N-terminal cleavage/methylation domain-containing protein [Patescibacteria group bacterium]